MKIWIGLIFALLAGCGHSLDSLDGPDSGKVSGIICESLELLAASKDASVHKVLIDQGGCVKINSSDEQTVKVIKTTMLPGDQKYSQIEYKGEESDRKMWIATSKIK
ncbi:MAG: hypothetical protein ACE5EH_10990 [Gammaproteobacteria bacterium]